MLTLSQFQIPKNVFIILQVEEWSTISDFLRPAIIWSYILIICSKFLMCLDYHSSWQVANVFLHHSSWSPTWPWTQCTRWRWWGEPSPSSSTATTSPTTWVDNSILRQIKQTDSIYLYSLRSYCNWKNWVKLFLGHLYTWRFFFRFSALEISKDIF